ncbi:MAG: hypothetical protein GXC73_18885 [Chitinophagaceae bacterium]|nr:hypothetical protein [Chitinophagaceae bacterium]
MKKPAPFQVLNKIGVSTCLFQVVTAMFFLLQEGYLVFVTTNLLFNERQSSAILSNKSFVETAVYTTETALPHVYTIGGYDAGFWFSVVLRYPQNS